MNELIHIGNTDIAVKEYHGKRVVTLREIDQCHQRPEGTAKRNFSENRNHLKEGRDFFIVTREDVGTDFVLTYGFGEKAPSGTLVTKSGYLMLVKSFTDDLAWDVQRDLVDTYFTKESTELKLSELSPTLQVLIQLETTQREHQHHLNALDSRLDNIGDLLSLNPIQWRKEVPHIIAKTAVRMGGQEHIRDVYEEAYRLLDARAGCNVQTRLTNLRQRMATEGVCKSKRDRTTKMDVIEKDIRLTEIFLAIVKELAIREGVTMKEDAA